MRSGPLSASTLPQDFVNDWMNSPPHRANTLRDYDVLEVGCFRDARTAYCTQLFVQEDGRLAEPVPYRLDASDELVLRLASPEAGVEQRISLRGADEEDVDPGSPVVAGTAKLSLAGHRGTNQLTVD